MGAHEHNPISSSLTHTLLLDLLWISHHQQDNDRTLQGIYCNACYLVGLLVYNYLRAAWNWAKRRMWLTSRRLAILVLLHWVSAQNENELVIESMFPLWGLKGVQLRNCAVPPDNLRSAILFSRTSIILNLMRYTYIWHSPFNVGNLYCFCVCMVSQLHALRAHLNKHVLSVKFSLREHFECILACGYINLQALLLKCSKCEWWC